MKKKNWIYILLSISLILFISIVLFLGDYRKHKGSFSSLCISKNEFDEIISSRKQSNIPLLEELIFDGNTLFFDKQDNRFYYSLVENSDTAYNPTVEWNDTLYDLKIKQSEITDELIHQNKQIDVVIYNDSIYSLASLTCTTLPLMSINVDVALEDIEDTYQDMRMVMFDNVNNTTTDLKGEIHARGSHVMYFPKKSFKIKLKDDRDKTVEPISLLDLPEGREYILYPGYNDQERIRNVFSTNLWYESCAKDNMYGLDNGQHYKYYEMFLNGKYWGLYAITYPIDENVLQLDLDKKSPNFLKENLYKKNNGAVNEYTIDWDSYPINGYDLKTNIDYNDAWLPLKNYYNSLFTAKTPEEIYELVDINNSIDIFLFYNLIQGIDNVSIWGNEDCMLHNTFLFSKVYKDGIKMLYCPWDMDRTWGNGQDEEPYSIDISYNSIMYLNPVFYLIDIGDDNIKNLVGNRYEKLRQNEWSEEYLLNRLNNYEKDIFHSGSYLRDIEKWPTSAMNTKSEELSVFKEYVANRLTYMDKYIEKFIVD